jgi:hypothetical protein
MNAWFDRSVSFSITISVRQVLMLSAALLLLCYLVWELYWYNAVGLYFIKWHTRLVGTALLTSVVLLPLWLWAMVGPVALRGRRLMSGLVTIVMTICAEGIMLLSGTGLTYSEQREGYYISPYEHDGKNIYHVNRPYDTLWLESPEFRHLRTHNALGFPGADWPLAKDTAKLRVICIGDSFTAGDGAPADSSYPSILASRNDDWEVFNAGSCGSDPIFGLKNLTDRILAYRPDLVIQTIMVGDIVFDLQIRGGFERFLEDSTIRYSRPPVWEPMFAVSLVARLFLKVAGLDIENPSGYPRNKENVSKLNGLLNEIVARYDSLGRAHGFKTLFVLLPMPSDLDGHSYDYGPFQEVVNSTPHALAQDLLSCYQQTMRSEGRPVAHYYWKQDGHHTSNGYDMMARCIERYIADIRNDVRPSPPQLTP